MMTTYIKQYGIQRSCTNFVKILLENNLEETHVLSNIMGWKHGLHSNNIDWDGKNWEPDQKSIENYVSSKELNTIKSKYEDGQIQYIICLKDPYSWLISYSKYDNRPDKIRTLKGLVDESRKLVNRTKGIKLEKISEYLKMWNSLHRNWSNLLDKPNCTSTKFEDLLKNPKQEVRRLAKFFNTQMNNEFYLPDKKMKRGGEKMNKENAMENKTFDAKYYTEKKYMSQFNEKTVRQVRKYIDTEIVEKLGYQII